MEIVDNFVADSELELKLVIPASDVPAGSLPEDGCPVLHRQEQVQVRDGCPVLHRREQVQVNYAI